MTIIKSSQQLDVTASFNYATRWNTTNKLDKTMKSIGSLYVFLLVLATVTVPNFASAKCPGNVTLFAGVALVENVPASFVGTGCIGVKVGIPLPANCIFSDGAAMDTFVAGWSMTTSRTAATAAGCSFMCGGGSCFVRGSDGLPVELMEFSVDE